MTSTFGGQEGLNRTPVSVRSVRLFCGLTANVPEAVPIGKNKIKTVSTQLLICLGKSQ